MMMKGIWIIPIAALMVLPGWARADGCNPRYQECGSYKDEPAPRARAMSYSYAYSARATRSGWCPPELNRRECRRIMAEVEARRARRERPAKQIVYMAPRSLRDVESAPRRGRCAGFVTVDGPARWTNALAIGAARKEWRRKVRTTYGERYIDERFSPNFRVSQPRIVGDRGFAVRATAQGTACAGD